ncbi:hypothetical protein IQ241_14200 [Romeria aff. gracilis LEGE 07310]|uniref:Uncharacterized protein n=1 Tax=Vasconcelosia minhoensis LEGE 07310 TaxID=915328 RepID=A0A8J7AIY7_9CYAN|nr:hypothetical protein [Romeria gracilis]MBE9078433.1 hypothetical protein [Romeria aff. gracilis LEGE 07310]
MFSAAQAQSQPAPAYRRSNPQEIAAQIYQQLPELPLENDYLSRDGTALPEDTLVSRLIRYHLYIQNRPPHFRFDWKLTMADYLGAFEQIRPERYPSSQTLRTNALEGDRAAIAALSREQRNQLVFALFQAFTAI